MALSKQDLEARAKAIADGKTRYIRPSDGQEWVIRNLNNPRLNRRYGGQGGTDETAVMRKGNRGGGKEGARKQAEAVATPDPETRRLADQEMARMRTRGNVGHHGLPVSSLAAGEREKPGTVQAYEKVHGQGNVGHTPGALVEMTPEAHDKLHHVDETKYYRSIKQAGQQADKVFGELGSIRFRRGVATSLAASGAALVGPLGTAASAAETAERTRIADKTGNIVDRVQAGISGFSLAADAVSYAPIATIPATIASTGADVLNMGIDTLRGMITFGKR